MYAEFANALYDMAMIAEISILNPVNTLKYGGPCHYICKAIHPDPEQVLPPDDKMQDPAFLRLHMSSP